jgi:ubiquinone/menaquinone biosynthesis C-methylase UbiE
MSFSQERPPVIDYEGSQYQSTFWDQSDRAYEDQVEAIALKRLLPPHGELLLEVGAGAGRNTPRYQGYERVVLLDYSRTQLRQAQDRLGCGPRYIYVAGDAYRLPFVPGLFEAATLIRTLHHLVDPRLALEQMRGVLQPRAAFILEYASKQNLKAILRYLLRRQAWSPFSPEPVEFAALNFDFHPRTVRLWLQESGFAIQRQLTVSHYRIALLKRLVPLKILVAMDSWAQLSGDWWQLTPSVFVGCKAAGETPVAQQGEFFRCPECGHFPLQEKGQALDCTGCGRRWGIHDGIYDFKEPMA